MEEVSQRNSQRRSLVSLAPFCERGLLARTKPFTYGLRIKRKHYQVVYQCPGIRNPDLLPIVGDQAGVGEFAQNFAEVRLDGASKASPIGCAVERNTVTERTSDVTELAVLVA